MLEAFKFRDFKTTHKIYSFLPVKMLLSECKLCVGFHYGLKNIIYIPKCGRCSSSSHRKFILDEALHADVQ